MYLLGNEGGAGRKKNVFWQHFWGSSCIQFVYRLYTIVYNPYTDCIQSLSDRKFVQIVCMHQNGRAKHIYVGLYTIVYRLYTDCIQIVYNLLLLPEPADCMQVVYKLYTIRDNAQLYTNCIQSAIVLSCNPSAVLAEHGWSYQIRSIVIGFESSNRPGPGKFLGSRIFCSDRIMVISGCVFGIRMDPQECSDAPFG